MEKEDIRIYIQGYLGLSEEHLEMEFLDQDRQLRLKYDVRNYDQPGTSTLLDFFNQLKDLPSTQVTQEAVETAEVRLQRQEVEELLQRLDPPIQV